MWHLLQPIASLLVGLFLGAFGLIHSFRSFPGMLGFNAFVQSLPAISGVLLFAVGLIAIACGLALLITGFRSMQKRMTELRWYFQHRQRFTDDEDDYRYAHR